MFEKFGEMDSYKEINELADNLFNEQDIDSFKEMAAENGIEECVVALYLSGDLPELCDAESAALGKIEVECKELKPKEIMQDWVEYIKAQCMAQPKIALAVRKKGKSLKGCMAVLLKYSFENRVTVDKKIVQEASIKASRVDFGVPGMAEAKKMIKDYYLGGAK